MKKLTAFLLSFMLCVSVLVTVHAEEEAPGIQVLLNGKAVAFQAAGPEILNGRAMVPFREILEAMGASVSYADGEISATLNETGIRFKVDSPDINVVSGEGESVVTMDVPPVVRGDSVLVPVRFLADSFGMGSGWDAYGQSVILIDYAKLERDLEGKFTVLDRMMKAQTHGKQGIKTEGRFQANLLFDGGYDTGRITFNNATDFIAVVQQGSAVRAKFSMENMFDISKINGVEPEERAEIEAMLQNFRQMDIEYIFDMRTMTAYVKPGEFLSELIGFEGGDTWIKMDYKALGQSPGMMDWNADSLTFAESMALVYRSVPVEASTYDALAFLNDFFEGLVGDKAFAKGENDSYSLTLDGKTVVNRLTASLLRHPGAVDQVDFGTFDMNTLEAFLDFNMTMNLRFTSETSYDYDMVMTYNADSGEGASGYGNDYQVDIRFEASGAYPGASVINGYVDFLLNSFDSDSPLKFRYDIICDSKTAPTLEALRFAPPEGAEIIDVSEMYGF